MPTFRTADGVPLVTFDPALEISPFTLFRRLSEGHSLELVDVRSAPGRLTLRGARSRPEASWTPGDSEAEIVLLDDNGTTALDAARRLHAAGFPRVRALFGGLELYEFSLDPEVVGADTFLVGAS